MNIFKTIALWRDVTKIQGSIKEVRMDKIKAGLKTTEFWLALIGANLVVFNQHLGLKLPVESIVAIATVIITYIIGRSVVKAKNV